MKIRAIIFIIVTSTVASITILGSAGSIFAQTGYQPLLPLPEILKNAQSGSFSGLLETLFTIFISVAAVAAVIMIAWGGFEYMGSEVPFIKGEGMQRIQSAIIGLLVIFSSVLILNTINPDITQFNILRNLKPIPSGTMSKDFVKDTRPPFAPDKNQTDPGGDADSIFRGTRPSQQATDYAKSIDKQIIGINPSFGDRTMGNIFRTWCEGAGGSALGSLCLQDCPASGCNNDPGQNPNRPVNTSLFTSTKPTQSQIDAYAKDNQQIIGINPSVSSDDRETFITWCRSLGGLPTPTGACIKNCPSSGCPRATYQTEDPTRVGDFPPPPPTAPGTSGSGASATTDPAQNCWSIFGLEWC